MNHNQMNYSRITRDIYIGTNFCCQLHFDKHLLKKGITVDISLEQTRVDAPFGVAWYLWLPTRDHTVPSRDKLTMGVHALQHALATGHKVYVHCKNGHGRAPTLVAAYFISIGMTAQEAIALIKTHRPEIHLEKTQKRALERFAQQHAKNTRA